MPSERASVVCPVGDEASGHWRGASLKVEPLFLTVPVEELLKRLSRFLARLSAGEWPIRQRSRILVRLIGPVSIAWHSRDISQGRIDVRHGGLNAEGDGGFGGAVETGRWRDPPKQRDVECLQALRNVQRTRSDLADDRDSLKSGHYSSMGLYPGWRAVFSGEAGLLILLTTTLGRFWILLYISC